MSKVEVLWLAWTIFLLAGTNYLPNFEVLIFQLDQYICVFVDHECPQSLVFSGGSENNIPTLVLKMAMADTEIADRYHVWFCLER